MRPQTTTSGHDACNEELLDRHNGLELTVPCAIDYAKSAGADGLADEISIGKDRSG